MQPPAVRKVKKKEVKGELDRLKQAEKKKRRLEKALATSAAIRSELEKKKQKKKEEQQRLDEEGAAIAEAVALHVLLGDADNNGEWSSFSFNSLGRNVRGGGGGGNGRSYFGDDGSWGTTEYAAAGLIAAQAVSSLRIREDAAVVDAYVLDGMLRG
ncbi:hypothetical protein LINPERPRIM_LOCUS11964 [Linum perenne]